MEEQAGGSAQMVQDAAVSSVDVQAKDLCSEQAFCDALFRVKRKSGTWKLVDAPALEAPVADTHAHIQYLPNPPLALARAAAHGVPLMGLITDEVDDGDLLFSQLDGWMSQASALLPRMYESLAGSCAAKGQASATVRVGDDDAGAAGACGTLAAVGGMQLPAVRICAGVHPHNAKDWTPQVERALRAHLADPRTVAVGEIGLDYHYDFSTRDEQKRVFACQLRLAHEAGMPVALHVREAHADAFAIMQAEGWPVAGTLLHCFTSDWETLEPWLAAGCFVAFGGALTFGNSDDIREAARHVPADRLLTETDSPYMAPVPLRGGKCEPAQVLFTAERLAQVRGCELGEQREALLQQLLRNAYGFLDRPRTAWQCREAARAQVLAAAGC